MQNKNHIAKTNELDIGLNSRGSKTQKQKDEGKKSQQTGNNYGCDALQSSRHFVFIYYTYTITNALFIGKFHT